MRVFYYNDYMCYNGINLKERVDALRGEVI